MHKTGTLRFHHNLKALVQSCQTCVDHRLHESLTKLLVK